MTESEIQSIRQSMEDGFFQNDGKHPKESEINACLRFFSQVDVIRDNKEPEDINKLEELLIGIFYSVIKRKVLISGFDAEQGLPRFIWNTIKIQ